MRSTKRSSLCRGRSLACLAPLLLTAARLSAQGAVDVDIATFAGLTIAGPPGDVFSVEFTERLTGDGPAAEWRSLDFVRAPQASFLWVDCSASVGVQRYYRVTPMESPTNMVFIPPGTFRMGSPEGEEGRWEAEGPQTDVTLTRGFWIGKYEVTQGEYLAVTGTNPSFFNGIRQWPDPETDYGTDLTRPVESVTWFEAVAYCAALTERERKAGRVPPNSAYRLPTAAEWEYACRAWTASQFFHGDDPDYAALARHAWYKDNSDGRTHPVGQKQPNLWGLHDTGGNVDEWCQDWFGDYSGGSVVDPEGPAEGIYRVLRGGHWSSPASRCRSAYVQRMGPEGWIHLTGFRVVLAPVRPKPPAPSGQSR